MDEHAKKGGSAGQVKGPSGPWHLFFDHLRSRLMPTGILTGNFFFNPDFFTLIVKVLAKSLVNQAGCDFIAVSSEEKSAYSRGKLLYQACGTVPGLPA